MPQDLADAVFQALRNSPQIVQEFGDTWQSGLSFTANTEAGNISKFYGDYAAQVALPQIVEMEPRETYQNMTKAPNGSVAYIADGQMQLAILASPRSLARQLGELVIFYLEDYPIAWPDVVPMNFRINSASFVPRQGIGPGQSSVFQRILTFDYSYSGTRFMPPIGGTP
jgi:hypothetical protein